MIVGLKARSIIGLILKQKKGGYLCKAGRHRSGRGKVFSAKGGEGTRASQRESKRDDALAESKGETGETRFEVATERACRSLALFFVTGPLPFNVAESEQGQGGKRIVILDRRVLHLFTLCSASFRQRPRGRVRSGCLDLPLPLSWPPVSKAKGTISCSYRAIELAHCNCNLLQACNVIFESSLITKTP